MRLFKRIKDPVDGIAQVVSSTEHSPQASWQNVRMQLVVQAMGVEPFSIEHRCMARADKWPHPGMSLPVRFDRRHHDRLEVDWDRVPSAQDRSRDQADAMVQSLRQGDAGVPPEAQPLVDQLRQAFPGAQVNVETRVIDASDNPQLREGIIDAVEEATGQDVDGDGRVGPGAGAAASGASGPPPSADLDQLERLARLHESGALTDEEFAQQKRKLLSG